MSSSTGKGIRIQMYMYPCNFKDPLIIEKKIIITKNGHPSLAGQKSLNAFRTYNYIFIFVSI